MSYLDWRNNDLSKYRSSVDGSTAQDYIGRNDVLAGDLFINMGNVSGTVSTDLSKYDYFKFNIVGNTVITGTHSMYPEEHNSFYFEIILAGSYIVTFDSWFEWAGGSVPSLVTGTTYLFKFEETNTVSGTQTESGGTITYTKCLGSVY